MSSPSIRETADRNHIVVESLTKRYADFAIGVILVLTVLFAPQGIVGLIERIKARRRARSDNKVEVGLHSNDASMAETRP